MAALQNIRMLQKLAAKVSPVEINQQMLQRLALENMLDEKRKKPPVPVTNPPPKNWSEVTGFLLERCQELKTICNEILSDKYRLFLFGSQLRGVSRSGEPDIDIWCYYPTGKLEQKVAIVHRFSYKLDFFFISQEPRMSDCIEILL